MNQSSDCNSTSTLATRTIPKLALYMKSVWIFIAIFATGCVGGPEKEAGWHNMNSSFTGTPARAVDRGKPGSKDDSKLAKTLKSIGDAMTIKERVVRAADPTSLNADQAISSEGVYVVAGNIAAAKGEHESAKKSYNKVLSTAPNHPGALKGMARVLRAEGKFAESIATYEKVLNITPEDGELFHEIGSCLVEKNDLSRAKLCFQKAIDLDARNIKFSQSLASLYVKQGREFDALEVLSAVQSKPLAQFRLAEMLSQKGNRSLALTYFEKAYQADPRMAMAKHFADQTRMQLGLPVKTPKTQLAQADELVIPYNQRVSFADTSQSKNKAKRNRVPRPKPLTSKNRINNIYAEAAWEQVDEAIETKFESTHSAEFVPVRPMSKTVNAAGSEGWDTHVKPASHEEAKVRIPRPTTSINSVNRTDTSAPQGLQLREVVVRSETIPSVSKPALKTAPKTAEQPPRIPSKPMIPVNPAQFATPNTQNIQSQVVNPQVVNPKPEVAPVRQDSNTSTQPVPEKKAPRIPRIRFNAAYNGNTVPVNQSGSIHNSSLDDIFQQNKYR